MSIYLDDELPKNTEESPQEDDFFGEKKKNELPYIPPDEPRYAPRPPQKRSGCFFLTPLGCIVGICIAGFVCSCIVPAGLTAAGVGVVALFASNTASRTGSESLTFDNPDAIVLNLRDFDSSDITIQGTDGNDITLNYRVEAYGITDSMAKDTLDKVTVLLVRQPNNEVTIQVESGGNSSFNIFETEFTLLVPGEIAEIWVEPSKDLTIENVTANFAIDATLSADVILSNVSGEFDVNADLGNITFTGKFRSGSDNRFEATVGDITMTLQEPLSLTYTASTSSGNMNCPDADCSGSFGDRTSHLEVITSSGDITIRTPR